MATSGLSNYNCPLPWLRPRESGHVSQITPQNHGITTRKMVPITGRAGSYLEFKFQLNPINFSLLSSSVSKANLSCVVATIFFSLAFLSSSIYMAKLSRLVAASFSSLALLSSSVSTANLRCLLMTTSPVFVFSQQHFASIF